MDHLIMDRVFEIKIGYSDHNIKSQFAEYGNYLRKKEPQMNG